MTLILAVPPTINQPVSVWAGRELAELAEHVDYRGWNISGQSQHSPAVRPDEPPCTTEPEPQPEKPEIKEPKEAKKKPKLPKKVQKKPQPEEEAMPEGEDSRCVNQY